MGSDLLRKYALDKIGFWCICRAKQYVLSAKVCADKGEIKFSEKVANFSPIFLSLCEHKRVRAKEIASPDGYTKTSVSLAVAGATEGRFNCLLFRCTKKVGEGDP